MRSAPSMPRLVAVAAGLMLAMASCTASPNDEETQTSEAPPAAAEMTTEEAAQAEATEAQEPSEEPSEDSNAVPADDGFIHLQIGDTFTTDNGNEITAHAVEVNIPYDFESDAGGAWHAIDVSYCIGDTPPETHTFQNFDIGWILRTEEGYTLDYPSSSWDDIITPQLELFNMVPAANECYRGWILIDGPSDATITSARFYEVDWDLSTEG